MESKAIYDKIKKLPWYQKLVVLQAIEGWGQEEAANKYGTTQKQVYLWNKGKSFPRRNNRKAIAAAHKVPETAIFPAEILKPEELGAKAL